MSRFVRTIDIAVLGLPGCLPSGLIGLVDLLSLVEQATLHCHVPVTAQRPLPRVRVRIAGLTDRPFLDGRGHRQVPDIACSKLDRVGAVVIPGFLSDLPTLEAAAVGWTQALRWLRKQHASGAWILSSCAGTFVPGIAGILDGRRCTTTWWLHDALRSRIPRADWTFAAGLTEDRRVITAGGPMSWVDIALAAVRALCGPDVARALADFAVLDAVPVVQGSVVRGGSWTRPNDVFLQRAADCVRRARGAPLSTSELAERLGVSLRTLHRKLDESVGETPLKFLQRIRLEMARTLLETHNVPIKSIAHETGWRDEGSFRRAFRRVTGQSPSGYRQWSAARRATPSLSTP